MPAWAGGSRAPFRTRSPRLRSVLNVALLAAAAVLAVWLNGSDPPPSDAALSGLVTRVVDGDTLDLAGRRIRLADLDAPEHDQTCTRPNGTWRCGDAATAALRDAVAGRTLTCAARDTDRYQRIVATCRTGDGDLGGLLVGKGLAIALGGYAAEQTAARAARAGLWQGDFITPARWRAEHGRDAPRETGTSRWDRFVAWLLGLFGS